MPIDIFGWRGADLAVRLAVCVVLSLVLHTALLELIAPESGYFARSAARGQVTDTRLMATLVRASALDAMEVMPGEAEVSVGTAPAPQAPQTPEAPTPPARRAALDAGSGAGDQIAYYGDKELDSRARPIDAINPDSPDLTGKVKGSVVLRLQINAAGTVDNVIVIRAVPDYAFGPDTFSVFKRARFVPAMKRGIPVASELLIELNYGQEN